MFSVFARLYKKSTLYFLIAITTPIGLTGAILDFIYGNIFFSLMYMFLSIGWNFLIFLPSIRQITRNEKLNKTGTFPQNTILNKNMALAERIISLLAIVTNIEILLNTIVNDKSIYFIFESLWFIITGSGHFILILVTRLYSKPQRHLINKEKVKRA